MSKFQNELMTVAIVEDDPMVLRVTKGFIEKVDGYICTDSYTSIKEAKVGLMNKQPMLVLLDVYFAESSGLELFKWIRDNELDIDVILITADHSSESIQRAMRFGAIDYLVKPFKLSRFEEALHKFAAIKTEITMNVKTSQNKIDLMMNSKELSVSQSIITEDLDIEEVVEKEKLKNNNTYNMIMTFFNEHDDEAYTAAMIGNQLGLARITARRYLDKMETNKDLELLVEYGTRGRPKNYYKKKRK